MAKNCIKIRIREKNRFAFTFFLFWSPVVYTYLFLLYAASFWAPACLPAAFVELPEQNTLRLHCTTSVALEIRHSCLCSHVCREAKRVAQQHVDTEFKFLAFYSPGFEPKVVGARKPQNESNSLRFTVYVFFIQRATCSPACLPACEPWYITRRALYIAHIERRIRQNMYFFIIPHFLSRGKTYLASFSENGPATERLSSVFVGEGAGSVGSVTLSLLTSEPVSLSVQNLWPHLAEVSINTSFTYHVFATLSVASYVLWKCRNLSPSLVAPLMGGHCVVQSGKANFRHLRMSRLNQAIKRIHHFGMPE